MKKENKLKGLQEIYLFFFNSLQRVKLYIPFRSRCQQRKHKYYEKIREIQNLIFVSTQVFNLCDYNIVTALTRLCRHHRQYLSPDGLVNNCMGHGNRLDHIMDYTLHDQSERAQCHQLQRQSSRLPDAGNVRLFDTILTSFRYISEQKAFVSCMV